MKHANVKIITVIFILMLLIVSSAAIPDRIIANSENSSFHKPILRIEKKSFSEVNVTVSIIVEPLVELESSFLYMKINLTFPVLIISKVVLSNVQQEDEKIPVFEITPENIMLDVDQPKFGATIPYPLEYYYYIRLQPKAGTFKKYLELNYQFNMTIYYKNSTAFSFTISSDENIVLYILPSANSMPPSLQNGIITTFALTFITPLIIWYINRWRKKKRRKERFSRGRVVSLSLFLIVLLNANLLIINNCNAVSAQDSGYILKYTVSTYYDIFNNDTYYLNSSYIVYFWHERQINATASIIGVLEIGKTIYPQIRYCEMDFERATSNISQNDYCFWFIRNDIDNKAEVNYFGYTLNVNGITPYYKFSMLREGFLLQKNDSNIFARAIFDKQSKILYEFDIKNKTEDTITVYLLNYVYGIKLSEKWDYYYELFATIISIPSIIITILTWPKKSKYNKIKRGRCKNGR